MELIETMDHLERVQADWLDSYYLAEPEYYNHRVDIKGKRHYVRIYPDESMLIAPSFTTVKEYASPMGYQLFSWYVSNGWDYCKRKSEYSAHYGTFLHIMMGSYLKGEKIRLTKEWLAARLMLWCESEGINYDLLAQWIKEESRDARKDLYGFAVFCRDYQVKPIAIEFPLMDHEGLFAGQCDFVCKMVIPGKKGQDPQEIIAMIDIKTGTSGFYEDHPVQLYAYKKMWNKEFPELQIDRVYNYGCHNYRMPLSSRVKPFKIKDQTDEQVGHKWFHWVCLYHGDPANKVEMIKTDFKLNLELDISEELQDPFEDVDILGRPLEHGQAF